LEANEQLFELIEKARGGDEEAFETLYLSNLKSILFNVKQIISNPNDAEDVSQEIVLLMYKNIGKLNSPYAFSSWLHRIVINCSYRYNEKKSGKAIATDMQDELFEIPDSDADSNPSAALDKRNLREEIMRAVAKLPEKQRLTLVMYYYDEMSQSAIGEALGVSDNTVSTNLLKAKKNLKTLLEDKITDRDLDIAQDSPSAAKPSIIALAFQETADLDFQNLDVDKFSHGVSERIHAISKADAGNVAKSTKTGRSFGTPAIVAATLTVVAAIAIVILVQITGPADSDIPEVDQNPATTEEAAAEELPNAEIIFENEEGVASHVNPKAATVEVGGQGYAAVSWAITEQSGAEVATGISEKISSELENLPEGNYSLSWSLKGKTHNFKVYRDFTIAK
jgi:RNA polymerase sigma-70 factor (ECF subfamily)